jgi:aspartate/glutamate racemase
VIDPDWQSMVDHLLGVTRESTDPSLFARLWSELMTRAEAAGADTIVVACLDLSAILVHAATSLRIVDAARCLAQEIVRQWLLRRTGQAC